MTIDDIINAPRNQEIVIDNPDEISELLAAFRSTLTPGAKQDLPSKAKRIVASAVGLPPMPSCNIGYACGRFWSYEGFGNADQPK